MSAAGRAGERTDAPILEGIRILDMTSVIFGPYCTVTLAELGADVIKLEPLAGDEIRRVGCPVHSRGMGPAHMTLNRGKRSVVWDLKSSRGQAALQRLLRRCDVFIHNLRDDAIERLGLGYEQARALRADLVYVHCTGFGSGGPRAGKPAYDDIVQAASGAASLLPRTDGLEAPRYLPMALADKVAGLHAVYAVLGALLHRQRTGQGQAVEVPMFESFTHFLMQEHLYGRTFIPPNSRAGYPRQLDASRQPVRCRDGYLSVAPYTDERWVRFFEVTGHAAFLQQEGLDTARKRFQALDRMQAEMARILSSRTVNEWLAVFDASDIPAAAVVDLDNVIDDPHLNAVGFFRRRTHRTEGNWLEMRLPVRFHGAPAVEPAGAPLLGEHSDDVARWLERPSANDA
ncbi:L-carnitine dehydratase/bile acid-inducible protein F [Burkholderia multivorans]|uniref:CaiB/BaiF CoA transferase family protein n=1 Tax=Burkholderia multivorans TaxID=87883 RepID=UPI0019C5A99C|nr:CoA transferase [Burkholderia multivorans]CAB5301175.1 L-carnitine dehydratase/bile acid-inducible protein F [Burkholderia multivorans]CAB5305371.1 L-carnitine dehydratase/bile acid-inducible protein F [Burkholderia multivorans]CAB5310676.1 L-carnitine dehydratase/bile acid-inducible protein F [Burkholderia multivorans]CAB5312541.1 L-carnitine dehydratase/bile acid-inducible protein F [Burkholderia multivorans]CAB5312681.1 L-carnitine dehydratase/bile acid-inducible protein F [Burkholderia 